MSRFGENVSRLLGLHGLRGSDARELIGVSPQAVSEWKHSKRDPALQTLLRVSRFFELPIESLVDKEFAEVLADGAGDPDRFTRVEKKIAQARRPLKPVA